MTDPVDIHDIPPALFTFEVITMIRAPGTHKKGFTLIELLVVLAIVASLIGLLLPAIQKARESSLRIQCVNNLKQIGLGWQLHESTHQKFPSGGSHGWADVKFRAGSPELMNKQTAGWAYQILPYIDQQNLWKGGRARTDHDRNHEIHERVVKLYVCPSRRLAELYPVDYELGDRFSRENASPLDYASCAGSHYDPNLHSYYPHMEANRFHGKCCYMNGIVRPIWERGSVAISEITDGTSNTIMVGEKAMNLTYLGRSQPADDAGFADGWDWDTIRLANPFYDEGSMTQLQPDHRDPNYWSPSNYAFGSGHTAVVNFVFADGGVRAIPVGISRAAMTAMGGINEGYINED